MRRQSAELLVDPEDIVPGTEVKTGFIIASTDKLVSVFSEVVEVLLAAVMPVKLLVGKVLGIGLVAFAQAGLIVAFALVLASSVGSDLLREQLPFVLASTLLWLVLGYTVGGSRLPKSHPTDRQTGSAPRDCVSKSWVRRACQGAWAIPDLAIEELKRRLRDRTENGSPVPSRSCPTSSSAEPVSFNHPDQPS